MTLSDKERAELIEYNLEKTDSMVDEIDFYIRNDKLHTAVNRIYYCVFYILMALALKNKFTTSKHMQLISWFNKEYIHGDVVDKKYSKIIRNIFEQRSKADYDVLAKFSKEQVTALYQDMKDTITTIKNLMQD